MLVSQKRSTRTDEATHNMGIHCQLCFLASLLLVIHAGPILKPTDDLMALQRFVSIYIYIYIYI